MASSFRADKLEEAIHSYGILLDENVKWDNEKMIKRLGDYFMELEPEKYSWGAHYVQSLATPMLCKHLKEEIKNFSISPVESNYYVAEEKVNGYRCCEKDTPILCEDGIRTIGEIVENKLSIKVLSYNKDKDVLEYKPVINWFINGKRKKEEWVRITYGSLNQSMEVTKNHKIYTKNRGYVCVGDIQPNDEVMFYVKGLNKTQKQLILGSFLGDGCISTEKRSKYPLGSHRMVLSHCEKQLDYLKLKCSCLGDYARPIQFYTSGYGAKCYNMVSKPVRELAFLTNNYYENIAEEGKFQKRRKKLTKDLFSHLDWLGIAIWYMDDGSLKLSRDYVNTTNKYCRVNIAVNKFNSQELNIIKDFFGSLGINITYHKSKGDTFTLNINSEQSQLFFQKIAPYIPECMEYKLPKEFREGEKEDWWLENKTYENNYIIAKNLKIDKNIKLFKHSSRKLQQTYDIEVADNHNFFAGGILVHNCISTYSPDIGFEFFSRRESSSNYLNSNFTDKFLFIHNGLISEPKDYKGVFPYKFVLDGELIVEGSEQSASSMGVSIEDYIQGILGSLPERAKAIQKDGHRLKFVVFDVLYFEKGAVLDNLELPKYNYQEIELNEKELQWVESNFKEYLTQAELKNAKRAKKLYQYLLTLKDTSKYDIRREPFKKRRQLRHKLVDFLTQQGLPITEVDGEDVFKVAYLDTLLREGKEGIVLKLLSAPYISGLRSSRSHRSALKVKQSINNMLKGDEKLVEDFDVFITGANPPKSERITDMIGSLSCSIYIKKEDGTVREHEIANVSGISHEWKRKLAFIDPETGVIGLNPEFKDKVIAINGLALTGSNLKFQHAVLKDRGNLEFKDKNPSECTWDLSALKGMSLIRGK